MVDGPASAERRGRRQKMSWRARLRDLVLAGGALSLAGCPFGSGGVCNATPDPCCAAPEGQACQDKRACEAAGGSLEWATDDGGVYRRVCKALDAGASNMQPADLAAADRATQD